MWGRELGRGQSMYDWWTRPGRVLSDSLDRWEAADGFHQMGDTGHMTVERCRDRTGAVALPRPDGGVNHSAWSRDGQRQIVLCHRRRIHKIANAFEVKNEERGVFFP